jgi:hypothetical protein
MKRISILLLTVASAVLFFSSCNKEYAEPTITWTPDDLSNFVTIGEEDTYNKTLNVTFNAEAGIAEIQVWKHTYKMGDIESVVWATPTGFDGLLTFDYTLTTDNVEADFGGGVTKIVYEVEVTDLSETPQTTTKEYTFMIDEAYAVTFAVEDEAGNAITDAKVTFNTVEMTAAPYVYNYIQEGTYTYTVEKAGYQTVTVTDFVMPASDTTVTVTLLEELPTAWAGPIALALIGQQSWASYNGTAVTIYESETIGFAFTETTATTVTVTKTDNCTGWVLVDDITALTTEASLEAAYTAGTPLATYNLPYDQHNKAFETKYFVSKIGDNYLLVEYIAGHRDSTTGNIVVFQYKD